MSVNSRANISEWASFVAVSIVSEKSGVNWASRYEIMSSR